VRGRGWIQRDVPELGRVLHALRQFGAHSETFLVDRMIELERLGWQAWVGAESVINTAYIEFPPDDRLLVGRRRDLLAARLREAVRLQAGPSSSWWVERAIDIARPQIVHAHFGWNGLAALPAARGRGLPLVVGLHGYDVTVYPRYRFAPPENVQGAKAVDERVYEELFEEATVIVTSRYLERRLRELDYAQPVEVIPSGIRLDRFRFRGPREKPAGCRLLFVGRLVAYKGLDVLLRALAALRRTVEPVHLDVIGEGPTREPAERLAEQLGVADLVRFHGALPPPAVRHALEQSDILVAPSKTTASGQAEALGNAIKEALAVGLQVVASSNGGIPEVTPPERRPELVSEGDHEALAARIEELWRDRAHWPTRAEYGRRWLEATFDWRILAPRIASVYESSASGRGRGR
jgi:colanic acid/amylovoran biosynthesis glycosyltransferase